MEGKKKTLPQTPERPKVIWMPSLCRFSHENVIELMLV